MFNAHKMFYTRTKRDNGICFGAKNSYFGAKNTLNLCYPTILVSKIYKIGALKMKCGVYLEAFSPIYFFFRKFAFLYGNTI